MARSEIAEALNRLENLAENWVMLETQRRVQESKDKETRIAEAYKYLIGQEDQKITQYETQIDSITSGLLDRGVEIQKLPEEHKTVEAEPLLQAAAESPLSMLNLGLSDTQNQAASYQDKLRYAKSAERHINLLDAAMSDNTSSNYLSYYLPNFLKLFLIAAPPPRFISPVLRSLINSL